MIKKDTILIKDLDEWVRLAGPKRTNQWKGDRSAMELARAWLEVESPALPAEVADVLSSHPSFSSLISWTAEPEVRLPFDDFRGEPRNSDLVVAARDRMGSFIVAVEGKADESFGETVKDVFDASLERQLSNVRSRGVARIEGLARSLFVPKPKNLKLPSVGNLRYQLLTATAGAVKAAELSKTDRVLLLIHEFVTKLTRDDKHQANGRDLDAFVARLSQGIITHVASGTMCGPIALPGEGRPQLFIGKAVRNLR